MALNKTAYLQISCDTHNCETLDRIPLTPIITNAQGEPIGWDDRGVDDWLDRYGWLEVGGGKFICDSCRFELQQKESQ